MDIKDILKKNFICQSEKIGTLYERVGAPLFRKDFSIDSFKTAKLYISGLGLYELYINGKKITKGKLAPYFSNPNHIMYYDEYDIKDELIKGSNAIGVLLGCGWLNPIGGKIWGFTEADWRSSERLSLVLVIDEKVFLVSDESFMVKPSHIIFNDLRCGEYADFRLYRKEDYLYGFIDDTFKNAKKTSSLKGEMVLSNRNPINVIKRVKPLSIVKSDDGYIYDFGENLAGIPSFRVKGFKGQEISLWHFEATLDGAFYNKNTCTPDADRYMSQKDIVICSGDYDYFEPSFTYHGFRYIYVEGDGGAESDLEMLVLSTLDSPRAHIECSNEIINKIQHLTINSDYSNFFHIPTDCPQREKNGWTGDASLSAEQFMYNFDASRGLSIWLDNIRKAQKEDGEIPGVIPTYEFGYSWGNGPNWDSVIIELPYNIYKFTGDKKVIIDNKDMIYKYLSVHLKNKLNENRLLSFGLSDWCEAGSELEYICSTPVEVTDTLEAIDMLNKAKELFDVINEPQKALFLEGFSKELQNKFKEKWVKDDMVKCATETAQAMAIKVNIFDNDEKHAAYSKLLDIIHENDDLMKYGVIGNKVIYDVLSEGGNPDLAIKLITQDRFPSFYYWIKNGATSLWEAFNELEDNHLLRIDGGRVLSLNHHFWGSVSSFFYKYIAGLIINPSFNNENEISIKPYLFSEIDHVKCDYHNKNFEIEFEVIKEKSKLRINILKNTGFKII